MLTKRYMTLIGIGVLSAGFLTAQPRMGRRAWRNPDAAQGVTAPGRVERIARLLNLTDDQKAQLQAIAKDARTQFAALAPQLKDQREAIQEAIEKNADDNTIRNLAAKQGDLQAQAAVIRIKAMAKFYAILTPDQKEKAAAMRQRLEELFRNRRGPMGP